MLSQVVFTLLFLFVFLFFLPVVVNKYCQKRHIEILILNIFMIRTGLAGVLDCLGVSCYMFFHPWQCLLSLVRPKDDTHFTTHGELLGHVTVSSTRVPHRTNSAESFSFLCRLINMKIKLFTSQTFKCDVLQIEILRCVEGSTRMLAYIRLSGRTWVAFQVQTSKDATVGLYQFHDQLQYEIVIGAGNNEYACIR